MKLDSYGFKLCFCRLFFICIGGFILSFVIRFGNNNNFILLGFIEIFNLKFLVFIIWLLNVSYFFFSFFRLYIVFLEVKIKKKLGNKMIIIKIDFCIM